MVQTFVIEETKELIYDSEKIQEWKEKCEALGLNRQIALTTKVSPIPFEAMNTVTKRVYETLCPSKVKYQDYGKTTIPLEVLGLIQLCENEKYFKEIQIWYDDKSPDPLAVGIKQVDSYEWNNQNYLIARWGDVLKSLEELKVQAIQRFKRTQQISMKKKVIELNQKLDTLDVNVEAYFDAQIESYEVSPI